MTTEQKLMAARALHMGLLFESCAPDGHNKDVAAFDRCGRCGGNGPLPRDHVPAAPTADSLARVLRTAGAQRGHVDRWEVLRGTEKDCRTLLIWAGPVTLESVGHILGMLDEAA